MSTAPLGTGFGENDGFHKHFHKFSLILEPSEPVSGPRKASQTASRPGSAGISFGPRMAENIRFYKGFCEFGGFQPGPPIYQILGPETNKCFGQNCPDLFLYVQKKFFIYILDSVQCSAEHGRSVTCRRTDGQTLLHFVAKMSDSYLESKLLIKVWKP